jgi:1-acyl-sn-glycerol-3-phosphate acyltransferase
MNTYGDLTWRVGRVGLGWPTWLATRVRAYGADRMPESGGLVLALNHLHWIDIPVVGVVSPRNINFVAKIEAHSVPGLGAVIRSFGALSVRRGEGDRDAVRQMRQAVRDGRVLGLFVEGTRQRTGRPGTAQPGAAMVALQEEVPVMPVAIYGTQFWSLSDWKSCVVAFGEPMWFEGLPKNGRGYKEATREIERRIHTLFDWLADVHARDRPRGETPPL